MPEIQDMNFCFVAFDNSYVKSFCNKTVRTIIRY